MRPPATESFLQRVRQHLQALPATERQLADFVLEFPGELASYAGNELAQLAKVSPLFQSAAQACQRGQMLATHRERSLANLTNTLDQLSEPQLSEIVQAIIAARQVLIFGSRSSHAFAQYLRWQIIQVVPQVISLPGPGETLAEYTAQLGKNDCVILFGMRRQTRQMAALLASASKAGASVLLVSDQASPHYAAATWSIQCDCHGPGLLDNHVAVMAVCDLLATMVLEAAGAPGRKRPAAIEQQHEQHQEF